MNTDTDRTAPLTYGDLERATAYTPTPDPEGRALDTLAADRATIAALTAVHNVHVSPALHPGVAGLFVASVSAHGTAYVRPVLAQIDSSIADTALDLEHQGISADPRAVSVEGITQRRAGYTVNGKTYTDALTLAQNYRGTWSLAPDSYGDLTDAARRKLHALAEGLAEAILTPERLAGARLSLAVSTLGHAQRNADQAAAMLDTARAIAAAALTDAQAAR